MFSIRQHPTLVALQAVALGLYSMFSSSFCLRRVDSQACFRGKAVSSNGSVSGDVDVRRLSGIMLFALHGVVTNRGWGVGAAVLLDTPGRS
ncbi:MAG: hypothetical protein ACK578_21745 [Pirellula sp.]